MCFEQYRCDILGPAGAFGLCTELANNVPTIRPGGLQEYRRVITHVIRVVRGITVSSRPKPMFRLSASRFFLLNLNTTQERK